MGDNGFSRQKWVHKDLQPAVQRAIELGWTAKKTGSGGWSLMSPGREGRFYLPITADNPAELGKTLDRLITKTLLTEGDFADGVDSAEVARSIDEVHGRGGKIIPGPNPTVECTLCRPITTFKSWEAYAVHLDREHPVQSNEEPPSEGVQEEGVVIVGLEGFRAAVVALADAQENTASDKMHDMEEAMQETLRPWRAIEERRRDGTVWTYESSAVLEVAVDGNVIGYKCPVQDCPYRHIAAKGIVSHHSQHVAKGEAPSVTKSNYKVESGDLYPQTITKGKWVTMKDDTEKIIYDLVHGRRQGKSENDSLYARALAERLTRLGYEFRKADEPIASPEEVEVLDKIRDLLGVDKQDALALEEASAALAAAQAALAEKDTELAEVQKELSNKVGFINTLAGFAQQEVQSK